MRLTITQAVQEFVDAGGLVRPRIEAIREVFPQAEFHSHEAAVKTPGGPGAFFFALMGLPAPTVERPQANTGRSDIATRAFSLVNEKFGRVAMADRLEEMKALQRQPGMHAVRSLPGRKFGLRADEALPIAAAVRAEDAWLVEQFGPAFGGANCEFPEEPWRWDAERKAMVAEAAKQLPREVREWLMGRVDGSLRPVTAGARTR
jgi:hypothetical protein